MFAHVVGDDVRADPVEWDIPRPAATTGHLIDAARQHGIAVADCLAGTDLSWVELQNAATEVQAGQELAILRNILARVDDPHGFARDVGLRYNFTNMGILGYALLASPTWGDAVNVACRFAMLSSSFLRIIRRDTEAGADLEFDDSHVPADVRQFMVERDLFALINMAPLLIGQMESSVPIKAELPGIDIPPERLNFAGLRVEIDTSAQRSALTIPHEVLRRAMPAADAAAAQMCEQQCEELLESRRQRRGMAAIVRTRLVRQPGKLPSMADIAEELNITERTLHRRLAAERTSYRALVDEVRFTLAVALLESGLTVEQTGRQLGYSETAAFTRAFIRWTDVPPSKHRRRGT